MKKLLLALSVISALVLTGCGENEGGSASDKTSVALITGTAGLGDRSFNDSAWAGLQDAQEKYGIDIRVVEPTTFTDFEPAMINLASSGVDMIVAVGFDMADPVKNAAATFEDVKFMTINAPVELDNVATIQFQDHEGSFLAGILASEMSEGKKVGFIGGADVPSIRRFLVGYEEGAKYTDENTGVETAFVGSFGDPASGKEYALNMYNNGVDIIFHAAGSTGEGIFEAAEDTGKYAIGVDRDQDYIKEGYILTSMIKNIDVAVENMIGRYIKDDYPSGNIMYGLNEGGVSLSEMKYTKDVIGEEILTKIDEAHSKISSGEIVVTDSFNN